MFDVSAARRRTSLQLDIQRLCSQMFDVSAARRLTSLQAARCSTSQTSLQTFNVSAATCSYPKHTHVHFRVPLPKNCELQLGSLKHSKQTRKHLSVFFLKGHKPAILEWFHIITYAKQAVHTKHTAKNAKVQGAHKTDKCAHKKLSMI